MILAAGAERVRRRLRSTAAQKPAAEMIYVVESTRRRGANVPP
jgi:hypothetical protein